MSSSEPLRIVPKGRGRSSAERKRGLRDSLWPDAQKVIWNRKTDDGYVSVPRTLPLILALINRLSPKGDGDASRVYLELWHHDFDLGFVEIGDEREHAFACGYVTPARAVRSWKERMDTLVRLGFLRVKPIGHQEYGYALIVHPHDVVESLKKKGEVPEDWYGAYAKRIQQTGARHGSVSARWREKK